MSSWAVVFLALVLCSAVALTLQGTAEAQSHSAVRSFSAATVAPGGRLEVSIVAEGYGAIGQVVETLPEGFTYQSSDMPEHAVSVEGRTVAFTLFQASSFTYVVATPAAEGSYEFSGIVKDQARQEQPVTGASSVRVGAAPASAPTTAPTRSPTAVPTRPPTRTVETRPTMAPTPPANPTPAPTVPPTSAPAATPTVAPTASPTLMPTAVPIATPGAETAMRPTLTSQLTATPTPRPTVTREPTATPTLEPTPLAGLATGGTGTGRSAPPAREPSGSADDLPTWAIGTIVGGVAALFVAGLVVIYVLARRRREERWRYSRW